mgnify:CR=1 FL=1
MPGYGSYNYYNKKRKKKKENFIDKFTEKAQRIAKRHKEYNPVIIEKGARTICKSWWGKAWCQNLERYADWENRIARGKDYVKHNTLVDLQINGGKISAKVQGAAWSPYEINIMIDPISEKQCQEISKEAAGEIKDIESLIAGKFPKNLKDLFFKEEGLFPSPKEIHFGCSCPDYAKMCKHIVAALYGIGVRLDSNPLYFFQMRGIDVDLFIAKVVGDGVESMLENANVKSERIIQNADLLRIFSVE